jgi:hypothetical protein
MERQATLEELRSLRREVDALRIELENTNGLLEQILDAVAALTAWAGR